MWNRVWRAAALLVAALCMAAAYGFSFGDKADSINDLFRAYEAGSAAVAQGDKDKAQQAFAELKRSFDQRFAALTDDKSKASGDGPGAVQARALLEAHARVMRLSLALLEANLNLAAGTIAHDRWVSAYEQTLSSGGEAADAMMTTLVIGGDRLERGSWVGLLEASLPAGARQVLASWLIEQAGVSRAMPRDTAMEFYSRILAASSDTASASAVLRQYVGYLQQEAGPAAAARLLDSVIATSAHAELGATAARLQLTITASQADRLTLAERLTRQHPDTPVAAAVRSEYIAALLARSDYEQALRAAEDGSDIAQPMPDSEKARLYLKLADKVETLLGSGDDRRLVDGDVHASWLGLKLAEQLLKRGDERLAVEVLRLTIDQESTRPPATGAAIAADEPLVLATFIEHFHGRPATDQPAVIAQGELARWAGRLIGLYPDSPQAQRIVTRFPRN